MFNKEAKEDSPLKKDTADTICQLNETVAQSMQQMSMSLAQVAQRLSHSFDFLVRAMVNHTISVSHVPNNTLGWAKPNKVQGPASPTGYT